jgi:hypothetical protein
VRRTNLAPDRRDQALLETVTDRLGQRALSVQNFYRLAASLWPLIAALPMLMLIGGIRAPGSDLWLRL